MINLNINNLLNKKFLIVVVFILVFAGYFLYDTLKEKTVPGKPIPLTTPAPAVSAPIVLSVSPANKSTDVNLYPEITIVLANPVPDFTSSTINIKSSPVISGEQKFSPDYKTLILSANKALDVNKEYFLSVEVNGVEIYSWSFTTSSLGNISLPDQERAQTEADLNFAKNAEDIIRDYPWREKLPLQTEDYFVYFDIEKKVFIGKIYLRSEPADSAENKIGLLKKQILASLEVLGVDLSRYRFIWKTIP